MAGITNNKTNKLTRKWFFFKIKHIRMSSSAKAGVQSIYVIAILTHKCFKRVAAKYIWDA
jgi:hypothetical protein